MTKWPDREITQLVCLERRRAAGAKSRKKTRTPTDGFLSKRPREAAFGLPGVKTGGAGVSPGTLGWFFDQRRHSVQSELTGLNGRKPNIIIVR
jgi:hypothetical protein